MLVLQEVVKNYNTTVIVITVIPKRDKLLNVFKKVEIEQTHSKQCAYELSASGTQVAQPENN